MFFNGPLQHLLRTSDIFFGGSKRFLSEYISQYEAGPVATWNFNKESHETEF